MAVVNKRLYQRRRGDLPPPPMDANTAPVLGAPVAHSTIAEVTTINQFAKTFDGLLQRTGGPRAFCGVAAPVHAMALARALCDMSWPPTLSDVVVDEFLLPRAMDAGCFTAESEEGLLWLKQQREAYTAKTPALRDGSGAARADYMRAWTANYELSDLASEWLHRDVDLDVPPLGMIFVRLNQTPQLAEATFEERERLIAEEARFGGKTNPDGSVSYTGDAVAYCVDTLSGSKPAALARFDEFIASVRAGQRARSSSGDDDGASVPNPTRVVVVDQAGHFATQLFYVNDAGVPRSVIFNTIKRDDDLPTPPNAIVAHDLCCAAMR